MDDVRKVILVGSTKVSADAIELLNLVDICKEMRTLPIEGGIFDQDVFFIYALKNIMIWRSQRQELEQRKADIASQRAGHMANP